MLQSIDLLLCQLGSLCCCLGGLCHHLLSLCSTRVLTTPRAFMTCLMCFMPINQLVEQVGIDVTRQHKLMEDVSVTMTGFGRSLRDYVGV